MTYQGTEESAVGKGHIHSAINFKDTGESRHDFVEYFTVDGIRYAQVVTFLEIRRKVEGGKPKSKYYAILQQLEEDKIVKKGHIKSCFKKYKWECTGMYSANRPSYQIFETCLVEFDSINGAAWIVPDFDAVGAGSKNNTRIGLRSDYQTIPLTADRFFHVPRKFTDRYEAEVAEIVEWRNYNGIQEEQDIMEWIRANQTSNNGLQEITVAPPLQRPVLVEQLEQRRFDIGDIYFDGEDEEEHNNEETDEE
jgi:hypothetical protein